MNKIICFMIFLITAVLPSDVYNIQFPDVSGRVVSVGAFKGKKIIVAVVNAKSPDINYLRYLNQLQSRSTLFQVIVVPATEFAGLADPTRMDQIKLSEKLSIIIAKPTEVRKDSKSRQHPLLAWLTNKDQNQHFDQDVDVTEKLFFISENGTLYGVLDKVAGDDVISNTLKVTIK